MVYCYLVAANWFCRPLLLCSFFALVWVFLKASDVTARAYTGFNGMLGRFTAIFIWIFEVASWFQTSPKLKYFIIMF
ncbi:hypothetical protein B0H12DRAFT_625481 [Mycena haematopus]|nr:hypothetical protein B0H12DRAFT_625481 [Mycena haematopus]